MAFHSWSRKYVPSGVLVNFQFPFNALAFLIGYTLATGELHIIIADVLGLI